MSHYMEVKDSDYNVLREVIELLNKKSKNGVVTLNFWDLGIRDKNGKGLFYSIYDEDLNPTPIYNIIKKN